MLSFSRKGEMFQSGFIIVNFSLNVLRQLSLFSRGFKVKDSSSISPVKNPGFLWFIETEVLVLTLCSLSS